VVSDSIAQLPRSAVHPRLSHPAEYAPNLDLSTIAAQLRAGSRARLQDGCSAN
jgi:hypothetical protein